MGFHLQFSNFHPTQHQITHCVIFPNSLDLQNCYRFFPILLEPSCQKSLWRLPSIVNQICFSFYVFFVEQAFMFFLLSQPALIIAYFLRSNHVFQTALEVPRHLTFYWRLPLK